jgi:hypothetical protein
MNMVLWAFQIALGLLCIAGGSYKITHFEQLQPMMASMRALPKGLFMFFGAFEAVAGVGLILPGVAKMMPSLTAVSAAAMVVESVVISAIYLYYGDRAPVVFTGAMAVMAVFIAYGRFVLKPF